MKTVPLAAERNGMKVCYQGLLNGASETLRRSRARGAKFDGALLEQLEKHLTELGRRYYSGDIAVVDEFLQLYCIEEEAREAVKQALNGAHQ